MLKRNDILKRARKSLIRQHYQKDCGVACLGSVIQYYGGEANLERLRELSGTSQRGTSLLGLYQAAQAVSIDASAFEADLDNLKQISSVCILHVLNDQQLPHYVVCYGYADGQFLIGDPGIGAVTWTHDELAEKWQSRAMLILRPSKDFRAAKSVRDEKWQWIRALVKDDLNVLGLALALGVIISVLSLSVALFSQTLIDDILPNEDHVKLIAGLVLLAVLLLAKNGITYLRQRFIIDQSRDFNNRVIGHYYGSLLRLPQPFFFGRKVGDLIARMNDTARLQQTVTYAIGTLMIEVLLLVTASVFILGHSVSLGLMALLSVPLFGLLSAVYHRPILQGHQQMMAAHAANESNYIDTIQGIATIKTSNKVGFFTRLTRAVYRFYQDRIYDVGTISIRFSFWAETIGVMLTVSVLAWSAFLVLDGRLQLGQLVAIFQMTGMLIPAAMNLALTNLQLQEARVAFDRMHEFASLEPELDGDADADAKHPPTANRLEVNHLTFRFPGRPALLRDISFSVRLGEMIALLGESGCGKTTTMHLLQRFYRPESGTITLDDHDIWDAFPTPSWRRIIGVVPQEIKVFNGSLLYNICLDDDAGIVPDLISFCESLGLDRFFEGFPQGYATMLGEDGIRISGGQKQLVALARALYQRPKILLLDEATAAMDRKTEASVIDLLEALKPQMAIILVTHRIRCARHADRIYIMHDGTIQDHGTPEELAAKENLFSASISDLVPFA